MGNQNVISQKREKELVKLVNAYIANGAPARIIAAECGMNWGMFQRFIDGRSDRRMLGLTARKLTAWTESHGKYMPEDYQRCTKCGKVKHLSEFHKDNRNANGHKARCAECVRAYQNGYNERKRHMANNNTEKAMTVEIVKKVKTEDNPDVSSAMLAPYFGITPKQLEAVRKGEWDSLLYRKEPPKPATDVKNAVEALRVEIADMHSALNRLMAEMGIAEGASDAD